MEDPPHFSVFQQRFLTGDNPVLKLDDEFLRNHTKVLLRSAASEKIWRVKLDRDKLADGWEEFAAAQNFRDGDDLVFKHFEDEIFHVSVASRSDLHHASSIYVDTGDGYIDEDDVKSDDDDAGSDDGGEDEDDDDGGGNDDVGNILLKKNKKPEADSSSDHSCFLRARVTRYSLLNDRLDLSRDFTVKSFGGHNNKLREIDVVNEQGRRWTMILVKNSSSGVFYIRRGWSNFCSANDLSQGDFCKFKLVVNGERPVLWLCLKELGNGHKEEEEEGGHEADAVKSGSAGGNCSKEKRKEKKSQSSFLTLKCTPSRYNTGHLSIPLSFTRENGLKESREIILLNKDGRKWSSYLQMTRRGQCGSEWFYMRRGWREMCEANGVKVNDSFVLELIWEDAKPMLKFCSKIENHENESKVNQRTRKKRACETTLQASTVQKNPRVDIEARRVSSREENHDDEKRGRTLVSNKPNTNSRKLQCMQPKSCSVSDQVTNVKLQILDTLNTLKQFRAELKTKEHNLEASLLQIDDLGERILGISKILNNNLI